MKPYESTGRISPGADWLVIVALIGHDRLASSAPFNFTNYYRDVGWGSAAKVSYIPALIGGKFMRFMNKEYKPKVDEENIRRYKSG